MSTIRIERATEGDAADVLALQKQAYQSEAAIYGDYAIPPLTQTLDELKADIRRGIALKATSDGVIVGSVRACARDGTCYVGKLIVRPDFRNRGIGTRLLGEIESAFNGCRRYELFTGHRSEKNLHLYEKLGYRPFKVEKATDRLDMVFLEKPNPAAPAPRHLLRLIFPQWQGSGKRRFLYDGARMMAGLLPPGAYYAEVPVSLDDDIRKENGIWGFRQLSGQLSGACDIIRKAAPKKIFLIGGDCGTEVAPVSYLNKLYDGDLAVLWLDAHGDLNSPATSASGNFHGMPLRCLLGEGEASLLGKMFSRLRPDQVILGGIRDMDPPEAEYVKAQGISVLTVDDLERDPACVSWLVAARGFRHVYVHIDLDVLDSGKCPWALCLTPDGIDTPVLMAVLRDLKARCDLAGVSIVELRPTEGMDTGPLKALVEFCSGI